MRLESFYNQPGVLQKGDRIAFDKKGHLYILYQGLVLRTTIPVKNSPLEETLYFNSIGSKNQCNEEISRLKWERYKPK